MFRSQHMPEMVCQLKVQNLLRLRIWDPHNSQMLEDAEAKPGGKKAMLRVGTFGGKEC